MSSLQSGSEMEDSGEMSLSCLPEACLVHILRLVDAKDLARLCIQDQRLRTLASQQELWQKLALARWPHATALHYEGDWQLLYRHRVHLPANYTACLDRAHQLTARAAGQQAQQQLLRVNGSSLPAMASPGASPAGSPVKPNVYGFSQRPFASIPSMLFDQVMQLLFSLCLWQARIGATSGLFTTTTTTSSKAGPSSAMTHSGQQQAAVAAEMRLVREDMAWWLSAKPESVLSFVRRTADMLGDFDMWGGGFGSWPDALWRRSAAQFLADLALGPEAGVCPSVTARLSGELSRLDDVMHSVDAEACDLRIRAPEGLPSKHWWYALCGRMAAHVC